MSKRNSSSRIQVRPVGRHDHLPIWIIASGGEVFIMKRTGGAITWAPAQESDFLAPASGPQAANEAAFDKTGQ